VRFCPFCSAENAVEATHCAHCARRLPPVPPRRQKSQPVNVKAVAEAAGMPAPAPLPAPGPLSSSQQLVPPPAALRRPPPAAEERAPGAESRRRTDIAPSSPAAIAAAAADYEPDDNTAIQTFVQAEPLTEIDPIASPPAPSITPLPAPPPPRVKDPLSGAASAGLSARRPKTASVPPPLPTRSPTIPPPMAASAAPGPDPLPPRLPPTPAGSPAPKPATPSAASRLVRDATHVDPPPTRIARPDALADRPFTPPKVLPVPEVPEPGFVNAARYSYTFVRARWQRRGAIKVLAEEIKQDTSALDQVLGALGKAARGAHVEGRAFAAENAAITAADDRRTQLERDNAELSSRRDDENNKFVEVERDHLSKQADAEALLGEAQRELGNYEAQRRGLREKRRDLERRQKAYLKAAEDREAEAGAQPMGDARTELRRQAQDHRREAAALEPERQDLDRRLSALERPIADAQGKVDAAKAEVDAARRSVADAREGHNHRLAEIEAEQKRKTREIGLADAEIQRRMVTLGTLVNLNRVERPEFTDLYERIDRLRGAIAARTTEIEKLTAEREAYDKGSLVRGLVVIGAGVVGVVTLLVILLALL
jgi:hypothetical protein